MNRPAVLTFVRYYLPGYKSGGPVRTIANMVAALGDEIEFLIVTSDRDATDNAPYPHLATECVWRQVGKARVLYLAPAQKTLGRIARIVRETPHDTLYLNSFFDPVFTLLPLLARRLGLAPKKRYVIAPRGEFSPGALELKPARKQAYLASARIAGLYRNLVWQASSEHEAEDLRRAMRSVASEIHAAPDLPAPTAPESRPPHRPRAEGEPLRLCFLSRISPMKNLDFALEVLQQVRSHVRFDIYGPIRDPAYWSRCRELMTRMPRSVEVAYRGSVEPTEVSSVLADYDLFFLPTLGENYGHVILEALAAGTPVLIADTTPWRDLADIGIGWDLPLAKPQAFAEIIDQMAGMTCAEQRRMRAQAQSFAESRQRDGVAIKQNRQLFAQASQ